MGSAWNGSLATLVKTLQRVYLPKEPLPERYSLFINYGMPVVAQSGNNCKL